MAAQLLIGLFGACTMACWVTALVSWILALMNLVEGEEVLTHMFNGMRSFDPANFTEVGQRHQRRMFIAFVGFFIFGGITAAASMGFYGVAGP